MGICSDAAVAAPRPVCPRQEGYPDRATGEEARVEARSGEFRTTDPWDFRQEISCPFSESVYAGIIELFPSSPQSIHAQSEPRLQNALEYTAARLREIVEFGY